MQDIIQTVPDRSTGGVSLRGVPLLDVVSVVVHPPVYLIILLSLQFLQESHNLYASHGELLSANNILMAAFYYMAHGPKFIDSMESLEGSQSHIYICISNRSFKIHLGSINITATSAVLDC